jgi:tetratricopeptide (TPR) repeat protein
MTVSFGPHRRTAACVFVLSGASAFLVAPLARSADNKPEPWAEVSTAHFLVASDGGEKTARRFADEFEQVRRVFQTVMPHAKTDTGFPIRILAAKDGKSFAKLLPEFPENKRRIQPAGLFVPGEETVYIALRANASGAAPYQEIIQQYARLILKRNYQVLPPWLEEGLVNVLGSMTFTDKGARLGRPDPEDLSVLWMSPLLPLDIVFGVNRGSAYDNPGDTTSMYFAESRALVHFLIADPQMSSGKALERYFASVESGTSSLESARRIFGDLDRMRDNLDAYIKQTSSVPVEVPAAGGAESISSGPILSQAEEDALLGDFTLSHGDTSEARTRLEDAVRLDPSLAGAEESLGFLSLREDQFADADKHFQRASQLDPRSALTCYGRALLSIASTGSVGIPLGAVAWLEKTVALDPGFAPAWSRLASIYALTPQTLERALAAAQHATSLVPGDTGYQSQLAAIQARLAQPAEVRSAGSQASPPVPAPPSDRALRLENKTEPSEQPPTEIMSPTARTQTAEAAPPVPSANLRVYSMVGTITEATCADAPRLLITLKSQMIVMRLHSDDIGQIAYSGSGEHRAANNASCASLRGRQARVSYRLTSGKKWDGEIEAIEFRNEP